MSHYKSYPAYRESGVEWIGQVPEHWEVKPVYSIATVRNGYPFKSELFKTEGIETDRLIRIRDIVGDGGSIFTEEPCPENAVISNGDVVIGMDGDFNVHRWSRGPAKLNQRMCAVAGRSEAVTKFLSRCLSIPLQVINDLAYATTVKHLSSYEVLHGRIAVPPADELRKINAALDRETTRIDALITKKTRFIELLKEKRQALITHAVTNGLDADVPMRNSGVEWIGKVPEHWYVAPIKYIARVESGHTPSRSVHAYWENCTVPWFTLADIWQVRRAGRKVITETSEKVSELGLANSSARRLPAGTVVLSRTASVGFPAILGREMATSQDFAAWICGTRLHNDYLYWCLVAMRKELDRLMIGSTHKTIYMPDIEAFRCPLPPINEQKIISNFIAKQDIRLGGLVEKTQRSIDLLKERRSALITAAVTGQIDLRESV